MERYEKIKLLGRGVFGQAFLMRRRADNHEVVIKMVVIEDMKDEDRENSKNEVRVLAMLEHPNVVGYQESFLEEGALCIVMEFADGGTLADRISQQIEKKQFFSEEQVLDWFIQMCLALEHVHAKGILHRDLKTQNVFLDRHNIVKLGDFGLAKVLTSRSNFGKTAVGTPYYLSPELVGGTNYNNKSDVWALGCILYEMLTLRHAFDAPNLPSLVAKIVEAEPPSLGHQWNRRFEDLIKKLLQKKAENRPSVRELLRIPWIAERVPAVEVYMRKIAREKKVALSLAVATSATFANQAEGSNPLALLSDELIVSILKFLNAKDLPSVALVCKQFRRFTLDQNLWRAILQRSFSVEIPRAEIKDINWRNLYLELAGSEVFVWGNNSTPRRTDALIGKGIRSAAFGFEHRAVVTYSGQTYTWGVGSRGQLGLGTSADRRAPALVKDLEEHKIVQVACGQYHTLFLTGDGKVFASGSHEEGQLGLGDSCPDEVETPEKIASLDAVVVVAISCGPWHSAAVTDKGELYTWGLASEGRLGHGELEEDCIKVPRLVGKLADGKSGRQHIVAVSCGESHTACLTNEGRLYTWGNNNHGQLGHGDEKPVFEPHKIKGLQSEWITHVACGEAHTCVLTEKQEIYVWGDDEFGQLGMAEKKGKAPASRSRNSGLSSSANGGAESCRNRRGGDNTPTPSRGMNLRSGSSGLLDVTSMVPRLIKGLANVISVAVGANHCVALTGAGEVYTWGDNDMRQLGHSEEVNSRGPRLVASLYPERCMGQIFAGYNQTAGIMGRFIRWQPEKAPTRW